MLPIMLTLREAAAQTGLAYSFLRSLCLRGEVVALRSGVKWLINSDSLAAYLSGESETDSAPMGG